MVLTVRLIELFLSKYKFLEDFLKRGLCVDKLREVTGNLLSSLRKIYMYWLPRYNFFLIGGSALGIRGKESVDLELFLKRGVKGIL